MGLAVGDPAGELLAPGLSVPVEESVLTEARIPVLLGLCVRLAVGDPAGELLAPGLSVPVEESVLSGARLPVLLGL